MKKLKLTILLLLSVFLSYGQGAKGGLNYPGGIYLNGPTNIGLGNSVYSDPAYQLYIGPNNANKGVVFPRGNVNSVTNPDNINSVYFHNNSDNKLYNINGANKIKMLDDRDSSRFTASINQNPGYQLIGSDYVINGLAYDFREAQWVNGMTGAKRLVIGTRDPTFDHSTIKGSIWYAVSNDSGYTVIDYTRTLFDDTSWDDRGITSFMIDSNTMWLGHSAYDAAANVKAIGSTKYRVVDTGLVVIDSFHQYYPVAESPTGAGGGFWGSAYGNGNWYTSYYKIDPVSNLSTIVIDRYSDTGLVHVISFTDSFGAEPTFVYVPAPVNKWLLGLRQEVSGAASSHHMFTANPDWSNLQSIGYKKFNSSEGANTRCPIGMSVDTLSKQIQVVASTRGGETDSFSHFCTSYENAVANGNWQKSTAIERPFKTLGSEYGYPFGTQIRPGLFKWLFTGRVVYSSYENGKIFSFITKYIPAKSDGGLSTFLPNSAGKALSTSAQPGIYNQRNIRPPYAPISTDFGSSFAILTWQGMQPFPTFIKIDTLLAGIGIDKFVAVNNTIKGKGISYLAPDSSFKIFHYPLLSNTTGAQTGAPTFGLLRIVSAMYFEIIVGWGNRSGVNGKAMFTGYLQSSTGVSTSANLSSNIIYSNGTVPFDTAYGTVSSDNYLTLQLGSNLAAAWADGQNFWVESWRMSSTSKPNVANTAWGTFLFRYISDPLLLPYQKSKKAPVSPYTSSSILKVTSTLDFPSTVTSSSSSLTVTVTGAVVGDETNVAPSTLPTGAAWYSAGVSSANTVTVKYYNFTGATVDPASGNFTVTVKK